MTTFDQVQKNLQAVYKARKKAAVNCGEAYLVKTFRQKTQTFVTTDPNHVWAWIQTCPWNRVDVEMIPYRGQNAVPICDQTANFLKGTWARTKWGEPLVWTEAKDLMSGGCRRRPDR